MLFKSTVWKGLAATSGLALVTCSASLKNRNNPEKTEVFPQPVEKSKIFTNAVEKSRGTIRTKMVESAIPGLSISVAVDGKTVWKRGVGYLDVENRVPATPSTVMRIASISKPITAAVVAKLWEDGRLGIDDPVAKYLNNDVWPSDKGHITIRQLLTHSSGVRHYKKKSDVEEGEENNNQQPAESDSSFDEFNLNKKFKTTADALQLFKDDKLLCQPGEAFNYTTHGFTVLAMVVEKVTGQPFRKYMKNFFVELGLLHTYLDEHGPLISNRSRYYRRNEKHKLVNAPHVDNSYKWAGGGFLSNVHDLVKFGNAILYSCQWNDNGDGIKRKETGGSKSKTVSRHSSSCGSEEDAKSRQPGFLNCHTVQEMWKPSIPISDGKKVDAGKKDDHHYGLGWVVLPAAKHYGFCKDQKFMVSHSGGAVGASSVLLILPRVEEEANCKCDDSTHHPPRGVVVAIICNLEGVSLTNLALDIAKCFEAMGPTADEALVRFQMHQC